MHDVAHSFFQQDIHCFSSSSQVLLTYAQDSAVQFGQDRIMPEHLLHAILRHNPENIKELFAACNVKVELLFAALESLLQPRRSFFGRAVPATPRPTGPIEVARETEDVFMRARRDAGKLLSELVHVSHLVLALSMEREDSIIGKLFEKQRLTRTDLFIALQNNPNLDGRLTLDAAPSIVASSARSDHAAPAPPAAPASASTSKGGRAAGATRARVGALVDSALERFAHNLTNQAQRGELDPLIGRAGELQQLIEALLRRTKNSPVLVGEPGVGKTAIVEGLAQAIVRNQVPPGLRGRSIVSLDLASLLAGAKYRGEFEERMKEVLQEIQANSSGIILFIDEVHTITGAGRTEGSMDLANLLKPALARGQIQCIGATTTAEYRLYIDKDASLERRFSPIQVLEPGTDDAIRMLEGLRLRYEDYHGITITDGAIQAAVKLSSRYIHDRYLPDKAIDLIDASAARLRSQFVPLLDESDNPTQALTLKPTLTEDHISTTVEMWTSIPVARLMEGDRERLLKLRHTLASRVIGQSQAVDAVADAILRMHSGLGLPHRPRGSFLFCGPTGVGKTELARVLAEALFLDSSSLIRLDMSEYMEKNAVTRLIGAPPGYLGFEAGGQLTEAVRRSPYCVLLVDEIEKAHAEVLNLFLQILDNGTLTDSQGRTVSFRESLIIMTSNAGQSPSANPLSSNEIRDALLEHFRPEFVHRLDEVLSFQHLREKELAQIATLKLIHLRNHLAHTGATGTRCAQPIHLQWTDAVPQTLAAMAAATPFGARPLERLIQQLVETPLSRVILASIATSESGLVPHRPDKQSRSVTLDVAASGEIRLTQA